MTQMVDWDLAVSTAATLTAGGPRVSITDAADVVNELRRLTDVAEQHVAAYTGLSARIDHPPVQVVDRPDWVRSNVEGLQLVMDPVIEKIQAASPPKPSPLGGAVGTVAKAVGSKATGIQVGTILGFFSSKVLGQYEVFSGTPGRLLLVAPNVLEVERKLGVDPTDFRLWVALHEVTHRTQFTAVPWLRDHFLSEVNAFVDATDLDPDALADRVRNGISALAEAVRNPDSKASVLDLVQTPAQRAVVERLTALMTLVEGHAEFVMDGVGPDVVPTVESIRARFNARRGARNPLDRLLRRLLGIEVKMRQYAEGRRFVAAVVEKVGMTGFNQIWTSPETLPLAAEIQDPDAWVARVVGAAA
ncbi:zinc-dependent metalloprotease [Cryptosporangium phraense]|uniref:Zinc-dependent metalloprotease n=1 Tax=Cryptosporangium phraense TaxID=2593070 RepID=A0A545AGZ0_9ACTN|nr:zinc-dependent metalloprotease [Cryptosporangium phraense]TQS40592.1 zinc-dependent metalloprotease [Cryptosporangium phraense]